MTTGDSKEPSGRGEDRGRSQGGGEASGRGQGGGGTMKATRSFTTISTIAVQTDQSQLLVSVLRSGSVFHLQLLQLRPGLCEIGWNQDQDQNLIQNQLLITKLQEHEEEALTLVQQRRRSQGEEGEELTEAMKASLSEGWSLLLLLLHRRQEVLMMMSEFHHLVQEFNHEIDKLEKLEIGSDDEVALSRDQLRFNAIRKDVLTKSLQVLTCSDILLHKLRLLQRTEDLQRRGPVLQDQPGCQEEECSQGSPQVALRLEQQVELLQDRRRRAEQGVTLQLHRVRQNLQQKDPQSGSDDWTLILDQNLESQTSSAAGADLQSHSRTGESSEPQTGSRSDPTPGSKQKGDKNLLSRSRLKLMIEETRDSESGTGSETKELQLGSRSDKNIQPGSRSDKDLQSTFKLEKDLQSGYKSDKDLQSESRSEKDLQSTSKLDLDLESGFRSDKDLQSISKLAKDLQPGSRSNKGLQSGSRSDKDLQSRSMLVETVELHRRSGPKAKCESRSEETRDPHAGLCDSGLEKIQESLSREDHIHRELTTNRQQELLLSCERLSCRPLTPLKTLTQQLRRRPQRGVAQLRPGPGSGPDVVLTELQGVRGRAESNLKLLQLHVQTHREAQQCVLSGLDLDSVNVVGQTMDQQFRTKQEGDELQQRQQEVTSHRKYSEQLTKVLQDLQSVSELLDSCTHLDLGSHPQTHTLTRTFRQATPHFNKLDMEVDHVVKMREILKKDEDDEEEGEDVVQLKLEHQMVKKKMENIRLILDQSHRFHLTAQQLEALLLLLPDPEASPLVHSLMTTAAVLYTHICAAADKHNEWAGFKVQQLQHRVLALDWLVVSWSKEVAHHQDKRVVSDDIIQLRDSFKDLRKRFNKLKFHFLKRNDRGGTMKEPARSQLQQVALYHHKLQGALAWLGSEVRDGGVAREAEDAVDELRRQMGEFERSVAEHENPVDRTRRLQEALDQDRFLCHQRQNIIEQKDKLEEEETQRQTHNNTTAEEENRKLTDGDKPRPQEAVVMYELKKTGHVLDMAAEHEEEGLTEKRQPLSDRGRSLAAESRLLSESFFSTHTINISCHRRVTAIHSQSQPAAPETKPPHDPPFSDVQGEGQRTEVQDPAAGDLSEAELWQQETMTEDSLSNDECPSPDDVSLPPLAETPESGLVQSDSEEGFNQHGHQLSGTGAVRPQTGSSQTEESSPPQTSNGSRFRSESDSCVQIPHRDPAPCVLQTDQTQPNLISASIAVHKSDPADPCDHRNTKRRRSLSESSSKDLGQCHQPQGGAHTPSIRNQNPTSKGEPYLQPDPPHDPHVLHQTSTPCFGTLNGPDIDVHMDLIPLEGADSYQCKMLLDDNFTQSIPDAKFSFGHGPETSPVSKHQNGDSSSSSSSSSDGGIGVVVTERTSNFLSSHPDSLPEGTTSKKNWIKARPLQALVDPEKGLLQNSEPLKSHSLQTCTTCLQDTSPPQPDPDSRNGLDQNEPSSGTRSPAPLGPELDRISNMAFTSIDQSQSTVHQCLTSTCSELCVHDPGMTLRSSALTLAPPPEPRKVHLHAPLPAPPSQLLTSDQDPDICPPVAVQEEIRLTPQIQGPPLPAPPLPAPPLPATPLSQTQPESPPPKKDPKGGPRCYTRPRSRTTIIEGSPVPLEVEVTGNTDTTLTWFKDEDVSAAGPRPAQDSNHFLFVPEASHHDDGSHAYTSHDVQARQRRNGGGLWSVTDVFEAMWTDWQTWFGTLCVLLWLLYLVLL